MQEYRDLASRSCCWTCVVVCGEEGGVPLGQVLEGHILACGVRFFDSSVLLSIFN